MNEDQVLALDEFHSRALEMDLFKQRMIYIQNNRLVRLKAQCEKSGQGRQYAQIVRLRAYIKARRRR